MSSIDWGRLYEQGRCRSIGVPWNEVEKHAVFVLKVPADYVRRGCLTYEAYEELVAEDKGEVARTGKIPLAQLRKEQLYALCQKQGLNVTPEATKVIMIEELKQSGHPASVPVV